MTDARPEMTRSLARWASSVLGSPPVDREPAVTWALPVMQMPPYRVEMEDPLVFMVPPWRRMSLVTWGSVALSGCTVMMPSALL